MMMNLSATNRVPWMESSYNIRNLLHHKCTKLSEEGYQKIFLDSGVIVKKGNHLTVKALTLEDFIEKRNFEESLIHFELMI